MTKQEFFALGGTQKNLNDNNFSIQEFVENVEGNNDFNIQNEFEEEILGSYSCDLLDYVVQLDPNHIDYYKVFQIYMAGGTYNVSKCVLDRVVEPNDLMYSVWHADIVLHYIKLYLKEGEISKCAEEYLDAKSIYFLAGKIQEVVKHPFQDFIL